MDNVAIGLGDQGSISGRDIQKTETAVVDICIIK